MESPFAADWGPSFEEATQEAVPGASLLDVLRQSSQALQDGSQTYCDRRSLDEGLLQAVATAAPGVSAWGAPCSAAGLLRSATAPNPVNVSELVSQADLLTAAAAGAPAGGLGVSRNAGRVAWVQPSGRRQTGQGCEDVEQAVLLATPTSTGGAMLRITLLAAGFCIGPSGASIRDVSKSTQTDIKSWTAPADEHCDRSCRVFRIEGPRAGVAKAMGIMCDAVERYKELCEGKHAGQSVARIQHVSGVDFHYQPPPRSVVPFAASLKGQTSRRQGSAGGKQGTAPSGKPPAGPQAQRQKGSAPSRTASVGVPDASTGPAPSSSLSRSTSLPHPAQGSRPGSSASPGHAGSSETARSAVGRETCPEPCSDEDSPPAPRNDGGPGSQAGGARVGGVAPCPRPGASKLRRAASDFVPGATHAAQHQSAPSAAPLAPAQKLGKGDVLRSVFGSQDASSAPEQAQQVQEEQQQQVQEQRHASAAGLPGSFDMGLLLRQLSLQQAQQRASHDMALASQQGVRGGYELSEPGVLLPASLSPMARLPYGLPPMSAAATSADAQLAAQSLASSVDMLAAVATAWQGAQAQQAAANDHLMHLAAAGLLGPVPGPGGTASGMATRGPPAASGPHAARAAPPAGLPEMARHQGAFPAFGGSPEDRGSFHGYGGGPEEGGAEEQRMPLSAFQSPPFFTPFSSVRSPRGTAGTGQYEEGAPTTPEQPRSAAAAMGTPPDASTGPRAPQHGGNPFASTFVPQAGNGPLAARQGGNPFASAFASDNGTGPFAAQHGGDFASAFGPPHGAPHGHSSAPPGDLRPALALLGNGATRSGPLGGSGDQASAVPGPALFTSPSMARAASVPGPQGSCTPLDRLNDLLFLARSNSFGGGAGDPCASVDGARSGIPPSGGSGPVPPSAGSMFCSAFSPSHRRLSGRLPSVPEPQDRSTGGVLGEVDRMLDSMF